MPVDVAIGILLEKHDAQWRVLIARRRKGTVYAGYWELPGGKVEDGESTEACLVREFAEELGVQVSVGRALPPIEHVYPHGHVRLFPFYCERRAGEPENRQVAEHRWVTADEMGGYVFPEANEALTREVAELLRQGDGAVRAVLKSS